MDKIVWREGMLLRPQHLQQQEQQLQFSGNQNGDHINNPNSKFVVLQTLASAIKRQQTSNPSAFFKRFEHLNTHNQRNHINNNLSNNSALFSSTPGHNRPPLPPSTITPSFPQTSSHMQKNVNHLPSNSNRTSNSILNNNHNNHVNSNSCFMSLPHHPPSVPSLDSFVPSPSSTRPAVLHVAQQQPQFLYTDQPIAPRNLGMSNATAAESSGNGVRYVSSPFAF